MKFSINALGVLFLSILIFASGCAHKSPAAISGKEASWKFVGKYPYLGTNKVYRYEYSNGLKLLVLEDHSAPVLTYHTWFNVGSRDEQHGLTGLAHLFEHMMFKATKNHPEGDFDRLLERAGSEMTNAFTSRDYTAYVQSVPKDDLSLVASLESDRMVNLLVNDDSLNKEREVVQNERRFRNENNPEGKLDELIYSLAFKKHSYHWPVIGYSEDLERAKSQQCYDFYHRHYAPNNATVVVVGDVNPDDVAKTIFEYYGKLQPMDIHRHVPEAEPAQTSERSETAKLKVQVEKLVIGYHVPPVTSADSIPLGVLRNVLAGSKSSRLYRKLVDGGIASEVNVEDGESKDPGLSTLSVTLLKGKTAKQALKVIDDEIAAVRAGKVTQKEIDRAVALSRFSMLEFQASLHYRALFLGYYETIAGDFGRGVQIVNGYKSVTPAAVAKAADKYFKASNRSVVIGLPGGGK